MNFGLTPDLHELHSVNIIYWASTVPKTGVACHFLCSSHPGGGRGRGERKEKAKRMRRVGRCVSPAPPPHPRGRAGHAPQPRPCPQTHFKLPPPLNDDQCWAGEPTGGCGLAETAVAEVTGGPPRGPGAGWGLEVPGGFRPGPPRPAAPWPAPVSGGRGRLPRVLWPRVPSAGLLRWAHRPPPPSPPPGRAAASLQRLFPG